MGQQVGDDPVDGESEPMSAEYVGAFECFCEGFLGTGLIYVAFLLPAP